MLIPMPLIDTVIMMADVVGNGFVESSFTTADSEYLAGIYLGPME